MLATAQEQIETRLLLSAAESKSHQQDEQLAKLAVIKRNTDKVVHQMIPPSIANRLRFIADVILHFGPIISCI